MARKLSLPVIGLLLAGAALGACRDEGGKGEYFAISGKLFEFNYRLAKATYIVTLNPMQPMDGSQVAVATFENPAGGEPLVIRQKIWPRLQPCDAGEPAADLRRQGQALRGVDQYRRRPTGRWCRSSTPRSPRRSTSRSCRTGALVVGPVYELNKDLAGHPDGRLPDQPKADCPAKV